MGQTHCCSEREKEGARTETTPYTANVNKCGEWGMGKYKVLKMFQRAFYNTVPGRLYRRSPVCKIFVFILLFATKARGKMIPILNAAGLPL